jgi:hypothetical protein
MIMSSLVWRYFVHSAPQRPQIRNHEPNPHAAHRYPAPVAGTPATGHEAPKPPERRCARA